MKRDRRSLWGWRRNCGVATLPLAVRLGTAQTSLDLPPIAASLPCLGRRDSVFGNWRPFPGDEWLIVPRFPTLEIGDPVPPIVLPSQSGERLSLHSPVVAGNPLVLLATRRLDATAEAELDILAQEQHRFAAIGARLLAMTGENPAENGRVAAAHGLCCPVLSDEPGDVLTILGVPSAAATPCYLLVIDHGLRLVDRFRCNGAGAEMAAALARCERLTQPRTQPVPVVTQQAPVLLIPHVFGPDLCRRLIDSWAEGDKQ
jgi:peroxiredoxin